MKPLSERDENTSDQRAVTGPIRLVGMKPLSERDENTGCLVNGLLEALQE